MIDAAVAAKRTPHINSAPTCEPAMRQALGPMRLARGYTTPALTHRLGNAAGE